MRHYALIGLAFSMACAANSSDPISMAPPVDGPADLDPFSVDESTLQAELRQGVLERRAIFLGNQLASEVFEEAANIEFAAFGIAARYEDRPLTPASDREGLVMSDDAPPAEPVDPTVPAGTEELAPESCAFAVAPVSSSISCRFIAREAWRQAETRRVQRLADQPLDPSFMRDAIDPSAVQGWYETAFEFGIDQGLPALTDALRLAGTCDQEPTQEESALERGVLVGRELMRRATAEQEAVAPRTQCNFDQGIVFPAAAAAQDLATVRGNESLCAGFVPQNTTERGRLERAQRQFREGILTGIQEQAGDESARLLRSWVCQRVPEGGGDGGGGGGGGGGGDPLVLDFDGDDFVHVESIEMGAQFDFGDGLVSTQWVIGDALLVFDADGDGEIRVGELFGDVSEFEDGSVAADGLEAAALYDAVERGGNGDGRLDAQDAIYSELAIWLDVNGDAKTDEGELRSLEEADVYAVDFTYGRWIDGSGDEHAIADVWFNYR